MSINTTIDYIHDVCPGCSSLKNQWSIIAKTPPDKLFVLCRKCQISFFCSYDFFFDHVQKGVTKHATNRSNSSS